MKDDLAITKADWPAGEWHDEPDREEWIDPVTGYHCLASRNMLMGFWCGYVGVPRGHPFFGKEYDDIELDFVQGLTYSDKIDDDIYFDDVVHLNDIWIVGFDCCNYLDMWPNNSPEMFIWWRKRTECTYKNLAHVRDVCAKLANALKEKA